MMLAFVVCSGDVIDMKPGQSILSKVTNLLRKRTFWRCNRFIWGNYIDLQKKNSKNCLTFLSFMYFQPCFQKCNPSFFYHVRL